MLAIITGHRSVSALITAYSSILQRVLLRL